MRSPLAASLALMASCSRCLAPSLFSSSCRSISASRSFSRSSFLSRRFWALDTRSLAGCSCLRPSGPSAVSASPSSGSGSCWLLLPGSLLNDYRVKRNNVRQTAVQPKRNSIGKYFVAVLRIRDPVPFCPLDPDPE
jgi:hypothetical protein